MCRTIHILALLVFSLNVSAQSAKKLVKTGHQFFDAKQYDEAYNNYKAAKAADPEEFDAYVGMGKSLYKMGRKEDAFGEFQKSIAFDEKSATPHFYMGLIYADNKEWKSAVASLRQAADRNKKNEELLRTLLTAELNLPDFTAALQTADNLNSANKNAYNTYLNGVVLDSLKRYAEAEQSYNKARFSDPKLIEAYLGTAHVRYQQGEYQKAVEDCNKAIEKDNRFVAAYIMRSKAREKLRDFNGAISDLSAVLDMDPDHKQARAARAKVYQKFGQPQNAIADWTAVLRHQPNQVEALYQRALAYESLNDYISAIRDYEYLRRLSPYDDHAAKLLESARERLFELNRESDLPELQISSFAVNEYGQVEIPDNLATAHFKGRINDASSIKSMSINNEPVVVPADSINPAFDHAIKIDDVKQVVFRIRDVYDNESQILYKVRRTEVGAPNVQLLAPYSGDDGKVLIAGNISEIKVEGQIRDESLIRSITINGVNASFITDKLNPRFTASVPVANKSHLKVDAEDVFGNSTSLSLEIDRSGLTLDNDNPMGKTWVVFIENSKYNSFASIDGPAKDVNTMKQAFSSYYIHNTIHKKNMTKTEMERFFSIELRDLVRSNQVNSLLVWYAGHGKYINNTGYWIPVDATRDDEFSFFNINALRASMQAYSNYITHTLVITDACESGPSFADITREKLTIKRCDDWQAAKLRSSQVFSSAGYELASDNSQFTRTFANLLNGNPDACIPIEEVVNKVSDVVKSQGNQSPKFGTIDGLGHENGTFFFMRKNN